MPGSQSDDENRVQDQAIERRRERTQIVEDALGRTGMLDERKYPVTAEEVRLVTQL
jgi:hypothetical protein